MDNNVDNFEKRILNLEKRMLQEKNKYLDHSEDCECNYCEMVNAKLSAQEFYLKEGENHQENIILKEIFHREQEEERIKKEVKLKRNEILSADKERKFISRWFVQMNDGKTSYELYEEDYIKLSNWLLDNQAIHTKGYELQTRKHSSIEKLWETRIIVLSKILSLNKQEPEMRRMVNIEKKEH